jgi:hypothetical protein
VSSDLMKGRSQANREVLCISTRNTAAFSVVCAMCGLCNRREIFSCTYFRKRIEYNSEFTSEACFVILKRTSFVGVWHGTRCVLQIQH